MNHSTDLQRPLARRAFLTRSVGSLGALSLAHLLAAAEDPGTSTKGPHISPRAKAVICLFQNGGPSQVDLFDPKPELNRLHGEAYPGEIETHFVAQKGKLLGSP